MHDCTVYFYHCHNAQCQNNNKGYTECSPRSACGHVEKVAKIRGEILKIGRQTSPTLEKRQDEQDIATAPTTSSTWTVS